MRSPLPHATILGYDLSAALALDGVVGAITGADVARHTKPFSVGVTAPIHYYCAATDRVRFVGEPVAVVVAKNRYLAEDAADLVRVDYDPLPDGRRSRARARRRPRPSCTRRSGRTWPATGGWCTASPSARFARPTSS